MIRNFKMLGLALVAIFAMSSLVASAASAALPDTDVFTVEKKPVKVTAAQENGLSKFTLAGQAVECTTATLSATVNALEVEEVETEQPAYSGCTYAGAAATVTTTGCKYLLTGTTDVNGDAKAHLKCGTGSLKLTLNAIACEIFVASQEAEEGYTMTTVGVGATRELTLHITAKVKVTSKGDPAEGVTCASLTNATGTLEGTLLATGEETVSPFNHIGITDHTTAKT